MSTVHLVRPQDRSLRAERHTDQVQQTSETLVLTVLLVVGLLFFEIAVPFLIQLGVLPGLVQNLDNLVLAAIAGLLLARILVWNHIPQVMLVAVAISTIGVVVAIFEDQGMGATIWGLWELMKFPTIGLLVYLQPGWPRQTLQWLRKGIYGLVLIQLLAQSVQLALGAMPGDSVSGMFGFSGTSKLVVYLCFALCFGLAQWIVDSDRRSLMTLGILLLLCSITSALGEMKLFIPMVALLTVITVALKMIVGGRMLIIFPTILLVALLLVTSVAVYNRTVAETRGTPRFEEYFDRQRTERYINYVGYDSSTGIYYLGRGKATSYAWQLIQRDMTTMLFGYGIGARTESRTLGIIGRGLEQGYYGLFTGTSLLIMTQELGLVGLGVLAGLFAWCCITLLRAARQTHGRDFRIAAYAIVIFTICWPLWLWYSSVWNFSVTMVLYWGTIGLLMRQRKQSLANAASFGVGHIVEGAGPTGVI